MMILASGRASRTASTTLRPVPSSSRMSSTAKAGAWVFTAAMASATLPTSVGSKPRCSSARPRRVRNGASSSSTNKDLVGEGGDVSG